MIAGLLRPRPWAAIVIDGETLDDTAHRIHVPAHRRRIGYVFQDARLFPHLDVRPESRLRPADETAWPMIPRRRARVTDLLDIGSLLDRRPGRLFRRASRQRVALGRALVCQKPRLAAAGRAVWDRWMRARKVEILPYLVRLRDEANVPMVYVSHDAAEMRQLATQIVMLRNGLVDRVRRRQGAVISRFAGFDIYSADEGLNRRKRPPRWFSCVVSAMAGRASIIAGVPVSKTNTIDLQILHDALDVISRLGKWNAFPPNRPRPRWARGGSPYRCTHCRTRPRPAIIAGEGHDVAATILL